MWRKYEFLWTFMTLIQFDMFIARSSLLSGMENFWSVKCDEWLLGWIIKWYTHVRSFLIRIKGRNVTVTHIDWNHISKWVFFFVCICDKKIKQGVSPFYVFCVQIFSSFLWFTVVEWMVECRKYYKWVFYDSIVIYF